MSRYLLPLASLLDRSSQSRLEFKARIRPRFTLMPQVNLERKDYYMRLAMHWDTRIHPFVPDHAEEDDRSHKSRFCASELASQTTSRKMSGSMTWGDPDLRGQAEEVYFKQPVIYPLRGWVVEHDSQCHPMLRTVETQDDIARERLGVMLVDDLRRRHSAFLTTVKSCEPKMLPLTLEQAEAFAVGCLGLAIEGYSVSVPYRTGLPDSTAGILTVKRVEGSDRFVFEDAFRNSHEKSFHLPANWQAKFIEDSKPEFRRILATSLATDQSIRDVEWHFDEKPRELNFLWSNISPAAWDDATQADTIEIEKTFPSCSDYAEQLRAQSRNEYA